MKNLLMGRGVEERKLVYILTSLIFFLILSIWQEKLTR